jgi:transposase
VFFNPDFMGAMIVRYVHPLTAEQGNALEHTLKHDASSRARVRAHGILLSSRGTAINEIATIYQVNRDTVGSWIKKWEHQGTDSLHDKPRSGRPAKLTPDEQQVALGYLKDNPRSLKQVVDRLERKAKKRISISTLKRLAKRAGLRWKRVRKSLKSLRDPEEFDKCKRELEALQQQEAKGEIDLYYYDESGFSLTPTVPYAWQESSEVIEVPCQKSDRINVLGFMNRSNDLQVYMFDKSVHTVVVICCVDLFCETIVKKTVVLMDNASIHTSDEFEDRLPEWVEKGLIIKYLPAYSPELNLIEILWRRIKYDWLPFSAYQCLNAMREALASILRNFGSEYQITFT